MGFILFLDHKNYMEFLVHQFSYVNLFPYRIPFFIKVIKQRN